MHIKPQLFSEADGSVTVELDLADYLPLFLRVNGHSGILSTEEKSTFRENYAHLDAYFKGVEADGLIMDLQDMCLEKYSIEDRNSIKKSQAYTLLYGSMIELYKNAIDTFLLQQHHQPDSNNTRVKFNFNIRTRTNEVLITFADSGPGFPPEFLDKMSSQQQQMAYSQQRQISEKRNMSVKGILGGGGLGLRQLIHQILTGKELPKNGQRLNRVHHFDSGIRFSNKNNLYCSGAHIEIHTQIAPIPTLDQTRSHSSSPTEKLDTTDSDSDHQLDSYRDHTNRSRKKSSSSPSSLSLDISSMNVSFFGGTSPLAKPHPQSMNTKSTLTLNIESLDLSQFKGTSPIIPTKQNDLKTRFQALGEFDMNNEKQSSDIPQNSSFVAQKDRRAPLKTNHATRGEKNIKYKKILQSDSNLDKNSVPTNLSSKSSRSYGK